MKHKHQMMKLARTLVRRRAELWRTLALHTSQMAVHDHSVGDSIDAAVDCEQAEVGSQLAAVEGRELVAITDALARIRDGSFGTCQSCEAPIAAARLEALPYATLCIKCQREEERSGRTRAADSRREAVSSEGADDESDPSKKIAFVSQ